MPFTDATKHAVLDLLESGQVRISEIAPLAGVSRQAIYWTLGGTDFRVHKRRFTEARRRYLIRLFNDALHKSKFTT
jgi:hypothetical protein